MLQRKGISRNIDWITFSIYLGLIFLGWLMIYAVTFEPNYSGSFFGSIAGKQLIWIFISLSAFVVINVIDWKFWQTFAYPLYAFFLLLLAGVLVFGNTIKGATSWYVVGGFTFQPSEFAKFGTSLAMAAYLSTYKTNLRLFSHQLISFGIFLAPVALILLQPDAGSALVFFSFLIVLYRAGLPSIYYLIGFFGAAILLSGLVYPPVVTWLGLLILGLLVLAYQFKPTTYWMGSALLLSAGGIFLATKGLELEVLLGAAGVFLILALLQLFRRGARLVIPLSTALAMGFGIAFAANYAFNNILQPHQQERINVWLRPELCDPRGSLYNVLQSKMAISSGGLQGKGFMEGTMTKLNYVPEQVTDFIFCTVGEEHGFIGAFSIVLMFILLLSRMVYLAERQRSNFARYYAYSLVGIIFIHFFINIGMTMGLVPIIGIPLPFISKGGSSLLGFTIMIAVLLKMDSNRFHI